MIKPLNKNVLVKPQELKTLGGIYLTQNDTNFFEVVKVGKNVMEVKEGNVVIIDKSSSKSIKYQNETYYLVLEENILGVVEE